tara:strand:- start:278 stop:418 length:141 start_codon:yes stop_codon:yes gene_type:complete
MDFLDEIPEEENELIKAIKELTQEIRELKDAIREVNAPPSKDGVLL